MVRLLAVLCNILVACALFSEEQELSFSTPDQLATLNVAPSNLIYGLISPLSGQPVLRETDLVVKGAQEIRLNRTFVQPSIPSSFSEYKANQQAHDKKTLSYYLRTHDNGWKLYPHLSLYFNPDSMHVRVVDPSGIILTFSLPDSQLISSPLGLHNTSGDVPGGQFDLRNTKIALEEKGRTIVVMAPDGTSRIYWKTKWQIRGTIKYLLAKEILPNGKVIHYHYGHTGKLEKIESLDPRERFVYASITFTGSSYTTSTGLSSGYEYEKRQLAWDIHEKRYESSGNHPLQLLSNFSSPFYRLGSLTYTEECLLKSYSGQKEIFELSYTKETPLQRVGALHLPIGENNAFIPVCTFTYDPPVPGEKEGTTTIKYEDGTYSTHHFFKTLLPKKIQDFDEKGELRREKCFSWKENHWLASIEMKDGKGNTFHKREYEYDCFGNPILETFIGDLTGNALKESYTIKRIFSKEGKNLLLYEEKENGLITTFSYLPNTNLVTSKLTQEKTEEGIKILLREFWEYDDCNNLLRKTWDDGEGVDSQDATGVTQRRITHYVLRKEAPFLHMPEWIEEKFWDGEGEKFLTKRHLFYDHWGNVNREEIHDSAEQFVYAITRSHNERGDLLSETDPLGAKAIYSYEARGRLETKTNFSQTLQTTFDYDLRGRLKKQTETGERIQPHISTLVYDAKDRKRSFTDSFENATFYTYDPIAREVIQTDYPSISSLEGNLVPVTANSTCDCLGRQLTYADANGHTTLYRHNAYGSITEITHPDGSHEHLRYSKDGQLTSHIDAEGSGITYKRDALGRILFKIYHSSQGEEIARESFTYKGSNLVTETGKEGNITRISHDRAGRKIREERARAITEWEYDNLGRVETIKKHNGDQPLFIHYKRDFVGNILEERYADSLDTTLLKQTYTYDAERELATRTRYINGHEATEHFIRDAYSRLVQYQDAESHITTISYEKVSNSLGQQVLQKRTVDPLGIITIETKNALGHDVSKQILNEHHTPVAHEEKIYDGEGNLLYQRDHVYAQGRYDNTQIVAYTYTCQNQVESMTRGYGTSASRTKNYTYFPSGKLATKTLPDGIILKFTYDPLYQLIRMDSSDGRIHHQFLHDKLGYLLSARDENLDIEIKRDVDPDGNVLREVFPSGLQVKKEYDQLNRPLLLKVPDHGEIQYTYDPYYLREVSRFSATGDLLYTHAYTEFDQASHLQAEYLPGSLGQISHATDLKGQKTALESPFYSQSCMYDPSGNLKNTSINGISHSFEYDDLSQLFLETSQSFTISYKHDSIYNRIEKNGQLIALNTLNEIAENFNLNGTQQFKTTSTEQFYLKYDSLNRLTEAASSEKKITFSYDPLARRLSKTIYLATSSGWHEEMHENYLYDGDNEIGAFSKDGEVKNFRVLGFSNPIDNPATIAVEIEKHIFIPITDPFGNIRQLIDLNSKTAAISYEFTAFGEHLKNADPLFNPWRFASKRYDPELELIYFGKRYYDPQHGRWLTPDPAGFIDSVNLYQYVLNNPYRYLDPRGETLLGFVCGMLQICAGAAIMATGVALEVATFGAYTFAFGFHEAAGFALMTSGCTQAMCNSRDFERWNLNLWKNTDVYAPDRPLPRDPRTQEPKPETDAPHTELGTQDGTKGKYPQAREFDGQGKPVRDVDFTDHGRPQNHSNPHQHRWEPNPTGGTPSRSKRPEPLAD